MTHHRKQAWLTTPSHPFVLVSYFGLIYLGAINLLDLQMAQGMTEQFGKIITDLWAMLRVLSGVLALGGAIGATVSLIRQYDPRAHLWIEFAGCVLIFLTQAFYEGTLVTRFGWTGTMETQGLAMVLALGGLGRAVQIPFQIRKYWRLGESSKSATLGR